jgi:hypothetical protein
MTTIQIPQPSMAINAEDVSQANIGPVGLGERGEPFLMWNNWTVASNVTRDQMIERVARVADGAPDHYLRVLVINAHGWYAYLHLGQGLKPLTPLYERWKGRVANIWFCSCALIGKASKQRPEMPPDWNDGNLFCSGLAKLTGAYVMASSDEQPLQLVPRWFSVPQWAGAVFRYEPEHGSVDWHHQYPSAVAGLVKNDPVRPPIAIPPRFRALQGGPGVFERSFPVPLRPFSPRPGTRW